IAEFVGWPMALLSLECPVSCAKTLGNAPERAVTTRQEAWMPLQATAQSEKLIFRPCRRASLAHLAGTDVPSDTARSAILTHRFCHTATMINITPQQLRKAANIQEKIQSL